MQRVSEILDSQFWRLVYFHQELCKLSWQKLQILEMIKPLVGVLENFKIMVFRRIKIDSNLEFCKTNPYFNDNFDQPWFFRHGSRSIFEARDVADIKAVDN